MPQNRPCIIQGAIDDWPAVDKWNNEYLCDAIGDDEVGLGDGRFGREVGG